MLNIDNLLSELEAKISSSSQIDDLLEASVQLVGLEKEQTTMAQYYRMGQLGESLKTKLEPKTQNATEKTQALIGLKALEQISTKGANMVNKKPFSLLKALFEAPNSKFIDLAYNEQFLAQYITTRNTSAIKNNQAIALALLKSPVACRILIGNSELIADILNSPNVVGMLKYAPSTLEAITSNALASMYLVNSSAFEHLLSNSMEEHLYILFSSPVFIKTLAASSRALKLVVQNELARLMLTMNNEFFQPLASTIYKTITADSAGWTKHFNYSGYDTGLRNQLRDASGDMFIFVKISYNASSVQFILNHPNGVPATYCHNTYGYNNTQTPFRDVSFTGCTLTKLSANSYSDNYKCLIEGYQPN